LTFDGSERSWTELLASVNRHHGLTVSASDDDV